MVAGYLPVFAQLYEGVPHHGVEPVKNLENADEIIYQCVFMAAVLQLMEENVADFFLGEQEVEVLGDDDSWFQPSVGDGALHFAGGIQPNFAAKFNLMAAVGELPVQVGFIFFCDLVCFFAQTVDFQNGPKQEEGQGRHAPNPDAV